MQIVDHIPTVGMQRQQGKDSCIRFVQLSAAPSTNLVGTDRLRYWHTARTTTRISRLAVPGCSGGQGVA